MHKNSKSKKQISVEIEYTIKNIQSGLKEFQGIWQAFEDDYSQKNEMQVRSQLQKLQKQRSLVRTWLEDQSLKEYHHKLSQARQLVEAEMSRFKTYEQNIKKGKTSDNQHDMKYTNTLSWLTRTLTYIDVKLGQLSEDSSSKKANECLQIFQAHKSKLRQIKKALQNNDIEPEDVDVIKEQVGYLVDNTKDSYPVINLSIYDDINSLLPQDGDSIDDESSNNNSQEDNTQEQSTDIDNDEQEDDTDNSSMIVTTQKQLQSSNSQIKQNNQQSAGYNKNDNNTEINILVSGKSPSNQPRNSYKIEDMSQKQYSTQRSNQAFQTNDKNINITIENSQPKDQEAHKWSMYRQSSHSTAFSLQPTSTSALSQSNAAKAGNTVKKSAFTFSSESTMQQPSKFSLNNQKSPQQPAYQVSKFGSQNPTTQIIKGQQAVNYKQMNFEDFSKLFDEQSDFLNDYSQQQSVYASLAREFMGQQQNQHITINSILQSGIYGQQNGQLQFSQAPSSEINSPYVLLINLLTSENENIANQDLCTKGMQQYSQVYSNQFLTESTWNTVQSPLNFTEDISDDLIDRWENIQHTQRRPIKQSLSGYVPTLAQKKAMEVQIIGKLSAEARLWLFYHRSGDIMQQLCYLSLLQQGWAWDEQSKKFFNGSVYYEPMTGRMVQADTPEIPDSD